MIFKIYHGIVLQLYTLCYAEIVCTARRRGLAAGAARGFLTPRFWVEIARFGFTVRAYEWFRIPGSDPWFMHGLTVNPRNLHGYLRTKFSTKLSTSGANDDSRIRSRFKTERSW